MEHQVLIRSHICAAAAACLLLQSELAYIGPGGGLSAIGAFLALVFAILIAIFGFVWYPVKRLLRSRKKAQSEDKEGDAEE